MAVTGFQAEVLRRIAAGLSPEGGTYVAGGLALNHVLGCTRVSRDIDVFNDTGEAVMAACAADTAALRAAGYEVRMRREGAGFAEAVVSCGGEATDIQWARDSAFRFFPLVRDDLLGVTLHPVDLATNKLLALVGRREPRDWVDAIRCAERVQGLGLLAWAACGKDPGYSPAALVEAAARVRFVQEELDLAVATGDVLDAGELSRRWHGLVGEARRVVAVLPPETAGTCVLDAWERPFRGDADGVAKELEAGRLRFHGGRIGGAAPARCARSEK